MKYIQQLVFLMCVGCAVENLAMNKLVTLYKDVSITTKIELSSLPATGILSTEQKVLQEALLEIRHQKAYNNYMTLLTTTQEQKNLPRELQEVVTILGGNVSVLTSNKKVCNFFRKEIVPYMCAIKMGLKKHSECFVDDNNYLTEAGYNIFSCLFEQDKKLKAKSFFPLYWPVDHNILGIGTHTILYTSNKGDDNKISLSLLDKQQQKIKKSILEGKLFKSSVVIDSLVLLNGQQELYMVDMEAKDEGDEWIVKYQPYGETESIESITLKKAGPDAVLAQGRSVPNEDADLPFLCGVSPSVYLPFKLLVIDPTTKEISEHKEFRITTNGSIVKCGDYLVAAHDFGKVHLYNLKDAVGEQKMLPPHYTVGNEVNIGIFWGGAPSGTKVLKLDDNSFATYQPEDRTNQINIYDLSNVPHKEPELVFTIEDTTGVMGKDGDKLYVAHKKMEGTQDRLMCYDMITYMPNSSFMCAISVIKDIDFDQDFMYVLSEGCENRKQKDVLSVVDKNTGMILSQQCIEQSLGDILVCQNGMVTIKNTYNEKEFTILEPLLHSSNVPTLGLLTYLALKNSEILNNLRHVRSSGVVEPIDLSKSDKRIVEPKPKDQPSVRKSPLQPISHYILSSKVMKYSLSGFGIAALMGIVYKMWNYIPHSFFREPARIEEQTKLSYTNPYIKLSAQTV